MTSLWSKFKAKDAAASPTTAAPAKKDPNAPQPTPLELMLADAGPIRNDGSDKFFGFENFGSTCYANSVIQCLYFSVPFRELVINFPSRTPIESLQKARDAGAPKISIELGAAANGSAVSPKKPAPAASPAGPGMKPEDKDSPEYKKKQALAAGPLLNMDYQNAEAYGMPSTLFSSLKDIFDAIIGNPSRIGVVSPKTFLDILKAQNDMFRAAMHQDAHEFLNYLLNEVVENVEQHSKNAITATGEGDISDTLKSVVRASLPEDLAIKEKARNTRWVHELFEGTLTSETRCLTCENTSQRDEPFLDLSVDLEQHSSVTSCLRKFSEEEMLCEKNKFHCDKCGGLQEAEKRMKVKRLPRILALHLKRFKFTYDDNLQRSQKLFHRVVYPYYLRLFNTTDDAEDPDKLYELYAVVVHIGGGPYHGHYVSIIKTQDRGWVLFDDEMVEPVDKAYVRNFFGGENSLGQNALACAYVLFYQETTEEAMRKEQEADGLAAAQKAAEREREAMETGKLNGTTNGTAVPLTPTHEHTDKFQNLAHAASAPVPHSAPVPVDAHAVPPAIAKDSLDHVSTVPASTAPSTTALPLLPKDASSLDKKAAKAHAKAEKARLKQQEKDDKAAKKAEEKAKLSAQLVNHKERIERVKALRQREEDDLTRAMEESRLEEEKRAREAAEKEAEKGAQATRTLDEREDGRVDLPPPVPEKDDHHHTPANGHIVAPPPAEPHSFSLPKRSATTGPGLALGEHSTGEAPRTPTKETKERKSMLGLNRFRQSSMSLKGRPKWLPGHGHGHKAGDSYGGHRDSLEQTHLMGHHDDEHAHHDDHHAAEHAPAHAPKEKEKKKGMFGGLNRKKSSLLP